MYANFRTYNFVLLFTNQCQFEKVFLPHVLPFCTSHDLSSLSQVCEAWKEIVRPYLSWREYFHKFPAIFIHPQTLPNCAIDWEKLLKERNHRQSIGIMSNNLVTEF